MTIKAIVMTIKIIVMTIKTIYSVYSLIVITISSKCLSKCFSYVMEFLHSEFHRETFFRSKVLILIKCLMGAKRTGSMQIR